MIFDIKDYVDPQRVRLYVAKPDKTIIGEIPEAYDVKRGIKLGNVYSMQFKIPYEVVNYNKELVTNPNINNIKTRYLIKFVYDNVTEWYLIKTPTDAMEEDVDYRLIEAYSLEYELAAKNIRNLSVVSKTATQILTTALSETLWTIGYVDASFDLLYRAFDVSNSSVLDFVYQIATSFNALVTFNTINRKVNFYIFDDYGTNKGLEVSYGNLLKSASKIENTDEFYTRLKVFGKDSISIAGQNVTGQNYIEDYSYFIYPFQRDGSGNVLSHSDYMSDSLCNALLDYQQLLTSSEGTYQTYLTQLSGYQSTLTSQQNVLAGYQNDLALIEDQISVANYNGTSTTSLVSQKNAKQAQIDSQNTAIATTQGNINTVNANITALQNSLSITNNFTNAQIQEWNPYIIVGTFENTNVDDPKQLLDLATAEFEKLKQPKVVLNISVVNFLECVTEKDRWGLLNLGDTITIKNTKVGIDVQAKIIEMNFDYEAGEVQLTISNVKELLSDEQRFLKDLYRANTTSGVVTANQFGWNDAVTGVDQISTVINNTWDAVDREIVASVDNEVSVTRKGIVIKDITDPNKMLIIQKGLIALSQDGGNNWKTAILPDRIVAERILGKIILGNQMTIGDNNGTFNIVGNLLTIKDINNIIRVQLGEYSTGKYGLKLMNKTGTATIIDEDGIIQTDTIQLADNVDSTHSLKLKFYIDTSVIRVDQVKLNFSVEAFRAYSTGAASGGGAAVTSASGGGAAVTSAAGGGATVTSASGGGATNSYGTSGGVDFTKTLDSFKNFIQSNGQHNHGLTTGDQLSLSGGGYVTFVESGLHNHPMYDFYLTTPNHTHSVTTPDHTHTVFVPSHTHTVSVPDHTHPIQYGIYEGTSASGIKVKVDGVFRDSTGYYSDQNLDLTQWITTSGWHTIELTSDTLGRINAGLYIRSFVGV